MFTLKEKLYLLQLLKEKNRKRLFRFRKKDPSHDRLVEKLEQMVRGRAGESRAAVKRNVHFLHVHGQT
ncbi:MAG: hypothetical protein ACQEXQ_26415 [Bacillota bacterium]